MILRILLSLLLALPQGIGGNAGVGGSAGFGAGTGGGGTTVAFDAVAHGSTSAAGTAISSFNLTIGAGVTNGAVLVNVDFDAKGVSAVGVTVGGNSATLVSGTDSGSTGNAGRTMQFGIATGSTHGAQAIVVTWTGTANAAAAAVSASGVSQSTPFQNGTFTTGRDNGSGGGDPSITISSATGDMTMDAVMNESGSAATAPTQTSRFSFQGAAFTIGMTGSSAAGTTTVTHAWTVGSFAFWEQSGCDFKHA